jgi:hypothetical protein
MGGWRSPADRQATSPQYGARHQQRSHLRVAAGSAVGPEATPVERADRSPVKPVPDLSLGRAARRGWLHLSGPECCIVAASGVPKAAHRLHTNRTVPVATLSSLQ